MARFVANVNVLTETFETWLLRTNGLLNSLSTEVLTANSTLGVTGNNQYFRKAFLYGTFAANTLAANTVLRGGDANTSANLNITSNAMFTGARNESSANSYYTNNQTFSNTSNIAAYGNSTLINPAETGNYIVANTSAVYLQSNNLVIRSKASVNAITISDDSSRTLTTVAGANVNISANVNITGQFNIESNYRIDVATISDLGTIDGTLTSDVVLNDTFDNVIFGSTAPGIANGNLIIFKDIATTSGLIPNVLYFAANTDSSNVAISNTVQVSSTQGETPFIVTLTDTGSADIYYNLAPKLVYSFPKAQYLAGKFFATVEAGNVKQVNELLVTHDGSLKAYITAYGTLNAPSLADDPANYNSTELFFAPQSRLGIFTAEINNANVEIKFQQSVDNPSLKIVANLIRAV